MTLLTHSGPVSGSVSSNPPVTAPNILLIRSASRVFPKALAALRREFPAAAITVLAAPSAAPSLRQEAQIIEVLPYPEGRRISLGSYGWAARRKLRRRRFDLAVVLYNADHGSGYANVETLARQTGAREIRGYFPDGGFRRLAQWDILRHTAQEWTASGWVVLNVSVAVLQLALFGAAAWILTLKARLLRPSKNDTGAS